MPKQKSGQFDQDKYVKQYIHENRTVKTVSFNKKNPEDMQMLEWVNSRQENSNQYIKGLIRKDMIPKKYPPTRYSDVLFGCSICKKEVQKGQEVCLGCGAGIKWDE